MTRSSKRSAVVLLAGWLGIGAALVRVAWLPGLHATSAWAVLQHESPTRTLPLLLALAVLVAGAWVSVTALLTVVAQLPGTAGRTALALLRRVAPAFLRRAVEVALGATAAFTVTAGVAQASVLPVQQQAVHAVSISGAAATLDRPTASLESAPATLGQPSAVPSLDRPASSQALPLTLDRPAADPGHGLGLVSSPGPRTLAHQARAVRVKVGDSLWRIAARSLPPGTDDAEIARTWHRWYAANRAVIGDDPALLHPGQLLTPPLS